MSNVWSKVEFQDFLNISEESNEVVLSHAPKILYTKKDKEHEAINSLIGFFMLTGFLFVYIALALLIEVLFSIITIVVAIIIVALADVVLALNYIKSNIYITPINCWMEIHQGDSENGFEHYCFTYYPIFSGKCHPNKAKNVIYKMYQEQVLKSKVDITQIEIYLRFNIEKREFDVPIGFFFQNGEKKSFKEEDIDRNSWKFFLYDKMKNENLIAIANWDHQFEWKNDLAFDFDKLHEYAPWIIKRWNQYNLKPLTEEFKEKIYWNLRNIDNSPKLKPWESGFENQIYENNDTNKDLEIIEEAIQKIIGDFRVETLKDIEDKLFAFKEYFKDLNS